jgi:SnoaL-like domain
MDTLDPRVLQELVDREKIRQVFYRYAFGVDTSDPEAVLSVFDDPCTLIVHFEPGAPALLGYHCPYLCCCPQRSQCMTSSTGLRDTGPNLPRG